MCIHIYIYIYTYLSLYIYIYIHICETLYLISCTYGSNANDNEYDLVGKSSNDIYDA